MKVTFTLYPSTKGLPADDFFWDDQRKKLVEVLLPVFEEAGELGTEGGIALLESVTGATAAELGIDLTLVAQASVTWAQAFTAEVAGKISKTNFDAYVVAYEKWVHSGEPLRVLINDLKPTYGPVRARMVGVTETTRAFASSNIIAWVQTGLVEGKDWNTAEDQRVCPICGSVQTPTPLDATFSITETGEEVNSPPAHVLCRCWLSPVVKLKALYKRLRETGSFWKWFNRGVKMKRALAVITDSEGEYYVIHHQDDRTESAAELLQPH